MQIGYTNSIISIIDRTSIFDIHDICIFRRGYPKSGRPMDIQKSTMAIMIYYSYFRLIENKTINVFRKVFYWLHCAVVKVDEAVSQ